MVPVNHYKFIENNLIPGYRSSGNYRIHRPGDFRCRSIDGQSRGWGTPGPFETRSPILARSQINIFEFKYGNPNSDVWKFIRADNPDKPWIREYSNTLRSAVPRPRSRYKVIPRLTAPAGATCDKPKIAPSYITRENRVSTFAGKTISGAREFYPVALTSSNNFLLKRRAPSVFKSSFLISRLLTAAIRLSATNVAAHETVEKR